MNYAKNKGLFGNKTAAEHAKLALWTTSIAAPCFYFSPVPFVGNFVNGWEFLAFIGCYLSFGEVAVVAWFEAYRRYMTDIKDHLPRINALTLRPNSTEQCWC